MEIIAAMLLHRREPDCIDEKPHRSQKIPHHRKHESIPRLPPIAKFTDQHSRYRNQPTDHQEFQAQIRVKAHVTSYTRSHVCRHVEAGDVDDDEIETLELVKADECCCQGFCLFFRAGEEVGGGLLG